MRSVNLFLGIAFCGFLSVSALENLFQNEGEVRYEIYILPAETAHEVVLVGLRSANVYRSGAWTKKQLDYSTRRSGFFSSTLIDGVFTIRRLSERDTLPNVVIYAPGLSTIRLDNEVKATVAGNFDKVEAVAKDWSELTFGPESSTARGASLTAQRHSRIEASREFTVRGNASVDAQDGSHIKLNVFGKVAVAAQRASTVTLHGKPVIQRQDVGLGSRIITPFGPFRDLDGN